MLLAAALFVFSACERDEMEPLDEAEANSGISEGESSPFFDDIDLMASEAITNGDNGRVLGAMGAIPGCAVLTHDVDTRTIVIDFGAGCTDAKNNVRKGKIIITRSGGRYFQSGSSHTTRLEGYYINNIEVAGTRTVTNVSAEQGGEMKFNVVLDGGKVTWPDGTTAEREVDHLRTWISTEETGMPEWHITGTASGINRKHQVYTSTINNTVVVRYQCLQAEIFVPTKGSLLIERPDKPVIALDYGDGSCDNEVTLSMNGRSRTITVKR